MSQLVSSKQVFIQPENNDFSAIGELPCNANLNILTQEINDALKLLQEKVGVNTTDISFLKLSIADLQTKFLSLQSQLNNLDVQNAYIDMDLGCLSYPCSTGRLSLATILQILKNEICIIKSKQ